MQILCENIFRILICLLAILNQAFMGTASGFNLLQSSWSKEVVDDSNSISYWNIYVDFITSCR